MTPRIVFVLALLFVVRLAHAAESTPTPPVRYVSIAGNLEVTVMNGATTVFKGYTDDRGRFETTPLEPGVYLIQLRIPRYIAVPVRYTLALAGARLLGDAMVGQGVALAMKAEVRRPGIVRGHVNGRRVAVAPTPSTTATAAPTPASGINRAALPRSSANSSQNAPRPAATVSSRSSATVRATPAAQNSPAQATLQPRPANSQPRIVNGRRYIWVASGPNSNLGSWRLDNSAAPTPTPAAGRKITSGNQPLRAPSASPTPTPRRR